MEPPEYGDHQMPAQRRKPMFLKFRSGKTFIITVVAIAVFTDIFLYGLIVPVFPFALQQRANVPAESVQKWISVLLAVYGAGLLVASPICGYVADLTSSRQVPFTTGLVTLAGSTVMLCVGSSISVLVIGRLLQGVSAAVVWTVGLALLVDTVGRDEIGEAMGIVAVAMSLGIFTAPLLGGIVYERGGYFAVFSMAFAFIGIDIILRIIVIEKKTARLYADGPSEEEVPQQSEQAAPEDAASRSWTEKLPPIITMLRHPRLLNALWATLMQAVFSTSFETTVPLYVKENFGFGSTGAGLVFLPIMIPSFLSPLVGKLSDRIGPRLIVATGFILLTPFLILLRLPGKHAVKEVVFFCALLALCGTALAFVITPIMAEITNVVRDLEEKKPGRFGKNGAFAQAYSLNNIAFAAGSLVGPLLAGFLKETYGWNTVTLVLGLISAFTAIPTFIYTGGLMQKKDLKVWEISRVSPTQEQ